MGCFFRGTACHGGRTQCWVFRDALKEVTDPVLLLRLRAGQEEQFFGRGDVIVHC